MRHPNSIDRRSFLQIAGGLSAALALPGSALAGVKAAAKAASAAPPPKARSCIVLWLAGGPSHLDTFDPKPGRPTGGPFKAIPTAAKDVQICEHLPQLAEQARDLAIVRSLTTKEGNHDRARYLLHTGYAPTPTVIHPALGSWVSEELGDPKADLPAFISIRGPSASSGFLGVQHGPFVVQSPGQQPENTEYPRAVDSVRFLRRQSALSFLEQGFNDATHDPRLRGRQQVQDRAVRMMYTPRLKAFQLSEEPEALVKAYGENDFGRGCLLARRLVTAGVKYVEVTLDGWDTHEDNFTKTRKLMGTLDPAFATLLRDLREQQLLEHTLVLCLGDFGRTPKINPREGRDHHPQASFVVLAGGGIRGGQVYGATDADGVEVADQPLGVPNLMATVATLMGMDPDKELRAPTGRPISITNEGSPVAALML